ncbi:Zn(II)2Cys6 transcription factor [Aspergillus homomorphus CBS 101889]|uniref:Putative C6 transcription factor n=1 Tax=Aspergillus homomorphus (strain CBS 101889) TaxID=1450537 RepID=A0A395I4U0_ASPHC|nr:putative C6 transcription factor [Aspergillus homomorphus CBS 101889]RAL14766.1 putative C6 transcription factor [Aspergillus homomorphus CBS 101889]
MPPVSERKNSGGSKRSCVRCNQRKVGCDKQSPCGRCVKAGLECVHPGEKRAPRKLRRPPVSEILAHLKVLEAEVHRLRSQVKSEAQLDQFSENAIAPGPQNGGDAGVTTSRGRLVVQGGRTRYVGDEASVILGDKEVCDKSSDEESDTHTSTRMKGPIPVPSIGFLRSDHSTEGLGPSIPLKTFPVSQLQALWEIYQSNVAPMIALLHLRSIDSLMVEAAQDMENLDPEQAALVSAVCFAAVVSMTAQQCILLLDEPHDICIENYRRSAEHAIAKANLISTQDVRVLQAATLFLLCLRRCSDSRLVWAESAIVVRVAQRQGVHRDGQPLGLSPYEIEMRRRLWWHICILDMLCSEDQGTDTQIRPEMSNTKIPSNIDIEVLRPEMDTMPLPSLGFSDITLCIIHCQMMTHLYWPSKSFETSIGAMSLEQRETRLSELEAYLETEYLQRLDLDSPIQWITAVIARLTLSKAWLVTRLTASAGPTAPNDGIFRMAVETVKFANLLHSDVRISQWAWLSKSYKHRHVVAYLLSELCNRPVSSDTDHAWEAVTQIYNQWLHEDVETNDMLQKPLSRLMERAAYSRRKKSHQATASAPSRTQAPRLQASAAHWIESSSASDGYDAGLSSSGMGLTPPPESALGLDPSLAELYSGPISALDWLTGSIL